MTGPIIVAGESLIDVLLATDGAVSMAFGGGPYNVARTVARLGGQAAFLGRLSTDRLGGRLRAALEADGVDLGLTVATDDPTTLAIAELDPDGVATYRFYVEGTAAAGLATTDVPSPLPDPFAVHVGTLGLALDPIASTLLELIERLPAETLVVVDPNCRPTIVPDPDSFRARMWRFLARASVVTVSVDDLSFLVPGGEPLATAHEIAEAGARVVLVTDGVSPVRIVSADRESSLPVSPVRVVDTIGAGDAFSGGFIAWWQRLGLGVAELDDDDAVRAATAVAIEVARRTCERAGAQPPTLAELAM